MSLTRKAKKPPTSNYLPKGFVYASFLNLLMTRWLLIVKRARG